MNTSLNRATSAADSAVNQLLHRASSRQQEASWQRALWVAGDDAMDAPLPAGLQGLTARIDIARYLTARGGDCLLNDYDFSPWPRGSLDAVYYRISKEKALVHHVINQALQRLRPGGVLYLAGYKQEGLKTYLNKAAAGGAVQLHRGSGSVMLGEVQRSDEQMVAGLPDQDYARLREVQFDDALTLVSKPGIFGWNKVDAGSRLLIEVLQQRAPELWSRSPERVLDLGCGYGYLSVAAAELWPRAEFVATDSHVGAVAACQVNFERRGIAGEVVAADGGDTVAGRFQAILCNPPFHRGFGVVGDLGEHFLRRSRELLHGNGWAVFVVNQFLPLERLATPLFTKHLELVRTRSFKVVAFRP